jgi:hypothetical protein
VKLATHLHLVPKSELRGAILPLTEYIFMLWCLNKQWIRLHNVTTHRVTFTFTFYLYVYNSSPLDPIVSHLKRVHALMPCSFQDPISAVSAPFRYGAVGFLRRYMKSYFLKRK